MSHKISFYGYDHKIFSVVGEKNSLVSANPTIVGICYPVILLKARDRELFLASKMPICPYQLQGVLVGFPVYKHRIEKGFTGNPDTAEILNWLSLILKSFTHRAYKSQENENPAEKPGSLMMDI